LLTGTEARQLADRLTDGDTLTVALRVVATGRRPHIRHLLEQVNGAARIAVLRAIEGARSTPTTTRPLWTMPGHLAGHGSLTSSVSHLVDDARHAITCSTYNFQRSSGLWPALQRAAHRPGMALRVYLDTTAADRHPTQRSPTTTEVAEHLHPGVILRTTAFDGTLARNHAKFLAIDHRFLLATSANFSASAERSNVEFGLLIDDRNLTEAVERQMLDAEEHLYEHIRTTRPIHIP
jgi:phosphatidylserine/phosphatidylglycerophosphate/cardiolipin synthase-like enzyme